jgi:hypothetical protein
MIAEMEIFTRLFKIRISVIAESRCVITSYTTCAFFTPLFLRCFRRTLLKEIIAISVAEMRAERNRSINKRGIKRIFKGIRYL